MRTLSFFFLIFNLFVETCSRCYQNLFWEPKNIRQEFKKKKFLFGGRREGYIEFTKFFLLLLFFSIGLKAAQWMGFSLLFFKGGWKVEWGKKWERFGAGQIPFYFSQRLLGREPEIFFQNHYRFSKSLKIFEPKITMRKKLLFKSIISKKAEIYCIKINWNALCEQCKPFLGWYKNTYTVFQRVL